uniref:Secreted protein n=1 Tax=Mola mola TaxID=94237 RepID=A0A3Q3W1C9_MOLML
MCLILLLRVYFLRHFITKTAPFTPLYSDDLCLSFVCRTSGLADPEANQKQQEGCTCVAHRASPLRRCADYQTGSRHACPRTILFFFSFTHGYLPVLSTFLMTTATWPFSMELSSLTMRMRQVQRMSRDRASRMRPTARSGKFTLTKMCLPAKDGEKDDWHTSVHFRLVL